MWRCPPNATLEGLALDFVKPKPRRRKNVALVAWDSDGVEVSCVVGVLVAAEAPAGGGVLRLELARDGAQVAAERRPAGTAAEGAFSSQRCALLLDPTAAKASGTLSDN